MTNEQMNEFVIIPFANNYLINRYGIIKTKDGDIVRNTFSNHTKRLMIIIKYNDNKNHTVSLAYVIGKVFLQLPINYTYTTATIIHKDGNYLNYSLDNLEWNDKRYTRSLLEKKKRLQVRNKYKVPDYISQINYVYPNIIECEEMKGFYYLPFSDHPLVISKEGKIYNLELKKFILPYVNISGYPFIRMSINNKYTSIYIHRLLTQLFIPLPTRHLDKNINELESNHIDGNKTNFSLDNLEWVTSAENRKHAYLTGLMNYTKVEARHVLNNKKYIFDNATDCAKRFNINKLRLLRHLKSKKSGTITKNWFVFKYFDISIAWPELTEKQIQKDTWNILYKIWYSKNTLTDEIIIHSTVDELCGVLNLPINNVINHLKSKREIPYKNWLIWSDDTPLVEVAKKNQRKSPDGIRKSIPLKFTSTIDNSVLNFESAITAGKYFNVDNKIFKYAIENKNGMFKHYYVEYNN
jgi:hypothetical protein